MGEIFISHASADRALAACVADGVRRAGHGVFIDFDREDGIAPGSAWQRTLLRELRICDAVVFLNSWAAQASMWCHLELVVAGDLGKRVYSLDLGQDLAPHPLLQSVQGVLFGSGIDASIRRLADSLESDGLAGTAGLRWQRGRPPYPGLAAMDVADAGVFFGRDDEVRDLVARVGGSPGGRDGGLVVVLGPSGAGKSSLVRAGLAARMGVPWSGWAVAGPFEPGIRPLDRLVTRLAALVPGGLDDGECRGRLVSQGLAAFGEWLADHAEIPARRLLITVDQAEQLSAVTPAREREDFLGVLGGGIGPGSPVTVVLTARSDRFDEIQQLAGIGSAIQAPFVIAPISRSRLTMVIEGPARRADFSFEPGLAGRMADDTARGGSGEGADALPFLAFALREMYDLVAREDRAVFTEADYERVGRIDGAITRRAQAAEAALPPSSGHVLDRMLPRFVVLDDERLPAARPVPRDVLTAAEQEVAGNLEDQRLFAGTADAVRLAHDRLITAWPRLATAVARRRDDLVMQARLERQAVDWKQGHGELLGSDAATDAMAWLAEAAEPRTSCADVGEYVSASHAAARRRRARTTSVLAVIVALALAASAIAVVAVIQRSAAVRQSRLAQSEETLAQSEEMAAEATSLLPADAPLAMLLSLQAYERAHTLQAESALLEAAQQPLDDLLSSGSTVESVAFSRDGRILAAGSDNGHVGLWDPATGRRTATLSVGSPVDSVAFSPDGRILAAADDNGQAALWDVATGHRTATATLSKGIQILGVAFSPDGRTLAAGDYSGQVGFWDPATGRRTATLNEGSPVYCVAFSPDERTLAVGDLSDHVGLWDPATGRRTATLKVGSPVGCLAFSPDGRTLAVSDDNGQLGLWDVATRRKAATLNEGSPVSSMAFSPDGRTLAAGELSGHVGLWDSATWRRTATLSEGSRVDSVAFSPDGRTLAAGDLNGDIGLWDAANAQQANVTDGAPVSDLAFSPDGSTLAAGDHDGRISLWNMASRRKAATLNEGSPVSSVAFSPDGRTLAVGDLSGQINFWDVTARRKAATLNEGGAVYCVAFSPDGHTLAVSDSNGHIALWDAATGRRTATLSEGGAVGSVAFSPDGRTVAAGDTGGHVGLWDVAAGRKVATLNEGIWVNSVAFSPDGRTVAVGDYDGHVGLWDVATGRRTATLDDGNTVDKVAFSADGRILAIGDEFGNVGFWTVADGRQLASVAENDGGVALTFSPDSQLVAIGGQNGTIVFLRQSLTELTQHRIMQLICRRVRHNMSRAQWAEYAPGQPYRRTCS